MDPQTVKMYIEEGTKFVLFYGLLGVGVYKLLDSGAKYLNTLVMNKRLDNPRYQDYLKMRKELAEKVVESGEAEEGSRGPTNSGEIKRTLDSVLGKLD